MTSFADLTLARRLERADALGTRDYARAQARFDPAVGSAWEEVAGGFAVFTGASSPVWRAVGLGMDAPVAATELDRMEAFYRARGVAPKVGLCPLADASLLALLGDRGYRIAFFLNVWYLPLPAHPTVAVPSDCVVAEVPREHEDVWVATVSQGFLGRDDIGADDESIARVNAHVDENRLFLVRVGPEPAGGAAMSVRDGVAQFFSTSVRPAYRGRGLQTAMLSQRLSIAARAGCNLATVTTTPGSGSQRNVERFGFRLAYTRAVVTAAG